MSSVEGVWKSIHQSWLAKGLGLGLLCWGFKRVQEKIPSGEDNRTMHQSTTPSLSQTKRGIKIDPHPLCSPDLAPCDFWLFPNFRGCRYETIEEMKEAVTKIIDTLTEENIHGAFQKLLERYCDKADSHSVGFIELFSNRQISLFWQKIWCSFPSCTLSNIAYLFWLKWKILFTISILRYQMKISFSTPCRFNAYVFSLT